MNLLEVTTIQGRRMFVNPARIQAICAGSAQTTSIVFDVETSTAGASFIEVQEAVHEVLYRLKWE